MSRNPELSVLLPVYSGVPDLHLRRCLDSIYKQTYAPAEVIVVEDGPLEPAQLLVLDDFSENTPPLRRIKLPTNQGAGVANQSGLRAATREWIAKVDADDVCDPRRFEKQVIRLREGDLDVLGTSMHEFTSDERKPIAIRRMPLSHPEIAKKMRMNNPINHPTSVYRRELALRVGGYSNMRYMQDYDLFARMLIHGARMANLRDATVLFRADAQLFARRSSRRMTTCEIRLQRNLRNYGLIGPTRMAVNLFLRLSFRRLPPTLMRLAYRLMFRNELPSSAANADGRGHELELSSALAARVELDRAPVPAPPRPGKPQEVIGKTNTRAGGHRDHDALLEGQGQRQSGACPRESENPAGDRNTVLIQGNLGQARNGQKCEDHRTESQASKERARTTELCTEEQVKQRRPENPNKWDRDAGRSYHHPNESSHRPPDGVSLVYKPSEQDRA